MKFRVVEAIEDQSEKMNRLELLRQFEDNK
jgi:hypothetical protein